jgi:hypothetical protein
MRYSLMIICEGRGLEKILVTRFEKTENFELRTAILGLQVFFQSHVERFIVIFGFFLNFNIEFEFWLFYQKVTPKISPMDFGKKNLKPHYGPPLAQTTILKF